MLNALSVHVKRQLAYSILSVANRFVTYANFNCVVGAAYNIVLRKILRLHLSPVAQSSAIN